MAHHVHRTPRLGTSVLINESWYYALLSSDREAGLSQLKALAERGSIMSMIYIGYAIEGQLKSNESYDDVLKWYRMAAESNFPFSVYSYSRALHKSKRFHEELQALESDSLKNYAPALNQLAELYRNGTYVYKDLKKAEILYRQSMDMGHLFARRGLASFYATGLDGIAKIPYGIFLFLTCFPAFCREYVGVGQSSERFI